MAIVRIGILDEYFVSTIFTQKYFFVSLSDVLFP